MKQLKESILDNDFDIKGVEMYEYDWLSWPCMRGSDNAGVIGIIRYFNTHQYVDSVFGKFKDVIIPVMDEVGGMEMLGYCRSTPGSLFEYFKDFLTTCGKSLQNLEKRLQKYHRLDKEQMEIIEIVNDVFSDPKLENIGPKWKERSFYLGCIHNDRNDRILISNYGDKKEYDLMCDIVANVCKKRNLEYKTEYGVDSVDDYTIRIYLK